MTKKPSDQNKVKAQLESDLSSAWKCIQSGMRIHLKNARNFGNIMIRADKAFGFRTKGKLYAWVKKTLKVTLSDQTLCNYRLLAENWPELEALIANADTCIDLYSLTLVEALKLIQKTTRKSKKPREKKGQTGTAATVPSEKVNAESAATAPRKEGQTSTPATVTSNEVKASENPADASKQDEQKAQPSNKLTSSATATPLNQVETKPGTMIPPKGDPALILSSIHEFFRELAEKSLDYFPPQARTLITKMADDFTSTYSRLREVLDNERKPTMADENDTCESDSPIVEAKRYMAMKRAQKKSVPQIADEIGLDARYVINRLKLLRLTPDEQRDVHLGKLDPLKGAQMIDQRDRGD